MRKIWHSLLFLALAAPAVASDGVLEINQTCAVQTGCFDGEPPGFPVFISGDAGRSYRLTSDLIVPDADTTAIAVSDNPDITIDLNNFSIIRAGCEGATTSCAPASGSGYGARGNAGSRGISVHDGSIVGMGFSGSGLNEQSEVYRVRSRWNRVHGISAGSGSKVADSTTFENGASGISTFGEGHTISGNTCRGNGSSGINAGDGATVTSNTADANGATGIVVDVGSTVKGNSARANGTFGFQIGAGSTVVDNAAYRNTSTGFSSAGTSLADSGTVFQGNAASENGGDGIRTNRGSTVIGNTAMNNGGDGIEASFGSTVASNSVRGNTCVGLRLASSATFRGNTLTNNGLGETTGGVNMGSNSCNSANFC